MAKKTSKRSRLMKRSTRGARRSRPKEAAAEVAAAPAPAPQPAAQPAAMSVAGMQIPGVELANVEKTVRSVIDYVQENPLSAVAVALGAGVMLTSMYWDGQENRRRGSS